VGVVYAATRKETTVSPIFTVPMAETHRPLSTDPVVKRFNREQGAVSQLKTRGRDRMPNMLRSSFDAEFCTTFAVTLVTNLWSYVKR
jgi:hypothetical protein